MSADTNTPYTLPAELKKEYKLDLIKDEMSSSLTASERDQADRELAALLLNPALTQEQMKKLLTAKMEIDSEPVKLSGDKRKNNPSDDPQNDTDKSAGPSLESTFSTAADQMAGLAATLGLAPDIARAAVEAGQKYVQFVTRAWEETTTQVNMQTSNTLAVSNQEITEQNPNKPVSTDKQVAAAPMPNLAEEARTKLAEDKKREHATQEIQDSIVRLGADAKSITDVRLGMNGARGEKLEALAAANATGTAAKLINDRPDGDSDMVRKAQKNTPAGADMLVIGNMSSGNTGGLTPLSTAGKAPATGTSRGTA